MTTRIIIRRAIQFSSPLAHIRELTRNAMTTAAINPSMNNWKGNLSYYYDYYQSCEFSSVRKLKTSLFIGRKNSTKPKLKLYLSDRLECSMLSWQLSLPSITWSCVRVKICHVSLDKELFLKARLASFASAKFAVYTSTSTKKKLSRTGKWFNRMKIKIFETAASLNFHPGRQASLVVKIWKNFHFQVNKNLCLPSKIHFWRARSQWDETFLR